MRHARHQARSKRHGDFDRLWQLRGTMLDCNRSVLRFVPLHLVDNRPALLIVRRQTAEMAFEMSLDLTLRFGEESEIPFVAQ